MEVIRRKQTATKNTPFQTDSVSSLLVLANCRQLQ